MAFATSFLTGALTRKLENWGQEDEAIAERIKGIGEQLVTAEDNASQKVDKLDKVARIMYKKNGDKGIQQVAYNVDGNFIDLSKDVDEIVESLRFDEPDPEWLKTIGNPTEYLGQLTQDMYEKDTSMYNNLYNSLNTGDKTAKMLVPERNYTNLFSDIGTVPSMGKEPIATSALGEDISKIEEITQDTGIAKVSMALANNTALTIPEILASDLLNPLEQELFKDKIKYQSAEDLAMEVAMNMAADTAIAEMLKTKDPKVIYTQIKNAFGMQSEEQLLQSYETKVRSQEELNLIEANPIAQTFLAGGVDIVASYDYLSDDQKSKGVIELDSDVVTDDNEIIRIVEQAVNEGKILKVLGKGYDFFVPL
jgi:hypothetical protein